MLHLPGALDGAIESGRAKQADSRRMQEMRLQTVPIDLAANLRDRVAMLPTRAAPAPLMDRMLAAEAEEIAAARDRAEMAQAEVETAEQHARRMRDIITEKLEKRYGRIGG